MNFRCQGHRGGMLNGGVKETDNMWLPVSRTPVNQELSVFYTIKTILDCFLFFQNCNAIAKAFKATTYQEKATYITFGLHIQIHLNHV